MAKKQTHNINKNREVIVTIHHDGRIDVKSNVPDMQFILNSLQGAVTAVSLNMQKPNFELQPEKKTPPFSKN